MGGDRLLLHATAVAVEGRAALIRGASGSGKSALALEAMGFGARLVADDRVILERAGDQVVLSAPDSIRGLIEARYVGILRAEPVEGARLALVVDLDETETERLPPARNVSLLSCEVPLLHKVAQPHFAAALVHYLRCGRKE